MSNPLIPPLPLPDDDLTPKEDELDPDLDDGQIDSAEADRLASEADDDDDDEDAP